MKLQAIGIIHSPFKTPKTTPRQGVFTDEKSTLEIFPQYLAGARDLKVGDKISILYWADQADRTKLLNPSQGNGPLKGVFSLRSPHRPNPILITDCVIDFIQDNKIQVEGLEAIDQSPLLDIKISMDKFIK